MKKIFSLFAIATSFGIFGQQWLQVGSTGDIPEAAESDIHVTVDGIPIVGYVDNGDQTPRLAVWKNTFWEILPPVTTNNSNDVEVTSIGNLLYLGYYDQIQGKYQVQQWDGSSWMLFGDPGLFSYYGNSAELEAGANPGDLWLSYINDGQNGDLKKWNGSTWSPIFAQNISQSGAPELYGADVASEGSKVYYLTNDFNGGSSELTLWNAPETSGPFSPYSGGFFDNEQQTIDLEVNSGGVPVVAYTKTSPDNEVFVARTDGGSGFIWEPPLLNSDAISEMQMELGGNDSAYVLFMDSGNGEAKVFSETAGVWDQLGGPVVTGWQGMLGLSIFKTTNKLYVRNQEGGFPVVRTWNHQPNYDSGTGSLDMCENAPTTTIFSALEFDDLDHDSVWVHAYSQNQTLIQNANINVTRLNTYSPNSPDNIFQIDVTPETAQSGSVTIDIMAIDGIDTLVYPVVVNVYPNPTPTLSMDPVLCNGNADGVIYIEDLMPSSNYDISYTMGSVVGPTVMISDGGGVISITGLSAGTYTNITVTSQQGCTTIDAGPHVLTEPTALVFTTTITNVDCFGNSNGVLDINASGGTGPYQYSNDGGSTFQPSNIFSGLSGGTYPVQVMDANGCFTDNSETITEPATALSVIAGANQDGCDGDMFTVTAAPSGGTPAYNIVWDNGVTDGVAFSQLPGTTTYSCTVTDDNGCIAVDDLDILVYTNPGPISVTPSNPSSCGASDGSLLISGLSPTTNYDVYYNNGGVQGPFNNTSTPGGDIPLLGYPAGSFSDVTVTDVNGCEAVSTGPFNLVDPSAPTVGAGADWVICAGEPVTLTATNPDNALISWDNGAVNNVTFNPTSTTTYTVTASSSGCTATDQVLVTVNPLPTVAMSTTDATCGNDDGTATAGISGGTAPYDVYWSNGLSTNSISNLPAQLYYINVTDANGCYVMDVATVSSSAISISGIVADNSCYGDENGTVDLTVTGTAPFTYLWSNGAITEDIADLAAGQYEVRVEDDNGCDASASFIVQEPSQIAGDYQSTNATCGVADGAAIAAILGGVSPYTYQWKDGLGANIAGATAATYNTAGAGAYQLEVTDFNGCIYNLFGSVSEDNGPIVTVDSLLGSTCADDGLINIDINSTFAIASTTWDSGQTTEDINNIGTGMYSVTVEDINTCKGVLTVEVPPILPDMIPICIVSVDTTTNTNLIVWEKPASQGDIEYFKIYRESSIAGSFQFVDTVHYASLSQYNDTIAYPALRSWRYQITVVDTCGVESLLSPEHKTMHVTYQDVGGGNYDIYWDQYEGFSYADYKVWRFTTQTGWTLLTTVGLGTLTVPDTPPTIDGLDYMIEINPPSTCTATKAQDYNSSRSNTTTAAGQGGTGNNVGGISQELNVSIFPNPSKGIFNVQYDSFDQKVIEVFDLSGKLVYATSSSALQLKLDLSEFEMGSYLLKTSTDNGYSINKLIVQ